jgi:hypothetical protein
MQTQSFFVCLMLLFGNLPTVSAAETVSLTPKQAAMALVEKGVQLIAEKGEAAFEAISDPHGEFFNRETALYAFVYDEKVVIRAHPYKPGLIGHSFKGKPDVRGKKFRDEIVEKALIVGESWTEYSYEKPGVAGIYRKRVYGKLVEYNGRKYVVCAGIYRD